MTDYFDRIERQLVASTVRLYADAQPTAHLLARRRFRVRLALASGVAAATAAAAVALLVLTHSGHRSATGIASHQTIGHLYIPAGLQASFAVLRRGQRLGDELPTPMIHTLPSGVNPDLSRLLLSSSSVAIWFVPGPSEECIAEAANPPTTGAALAMYSGACSPLKQTEEDGILSEGLAGASQLIAGVVPDGVKSVNVLLENGASTMLTPNADGAFAQYLTSRPAEIVYHDADGSSRAVHAATPTTAPAPPNPCAATSSWCR